MPNLPFDYSTQAEELKRKRALYDNIAKSSMQQNPGQMISGRYVGPGIGDAVARVISAYLASKGQKEVDEGQKQLRADYNTNLGKSIEDYTNLRSGAPAKEMPYDESQIRNTMENDQPLPAQAMSPEVKADPRAAAIRAVTSGFPELQQLGMADMTNLNKTEAPLSVKDVLAHATPDSLTKMVQGGGLGAFQGKQDLKTVGDVVFDPNTKQMVKLAGPAPTRETINGDLYQGSPSTGELKKLDNAPKISVSSSFSPTIAGQKKGVEAYFTHAAGKVDELGKQAGASGQLLNTLETLKQLHTAGINGGVTSDMATTAANLAQSLGLKVDTNRLGNTETYNSLITDLWQRSVSQYGGNRGVTAAEAEEIKKLTPMARNSPQAREQLFAIQEGAAKRNIAMYQQANKNFAKAAAADDPTLFEIPDMIEGAYTPPAMNTPNPTVPLQGQQAAPMSWADYKASLGAK